MPDNPPESFGHQVHDWAKYVGDRDVLLAERLPDATRHLAMRSVFSSLIFGDPRIVRAANRPRRRLLEEAESALIVKMTQVSEDDAGVAEASVDT